MPSQYIYSINSCLSLQYKILSNPNAIRPTLSDFICNKQFTVNNIYLTIKSGDPHTLRFLSLTLQYTTATAVLTNVATIAGAIIPAGFTLPYCCL